MTLKTGIIIATASLVAIALIGLYRTKKWSDLLKDIDWSDEGNMGI